MERIALIALGGAIGALARYHAQALANAIVGHTTLWGTFVVNISGCFGLGLLVGLSEEHWAVSPLLRVMLTAGFFGAYTTFSTLMYDSVARMETGEYLTLGANLVASVIIGLAAAYAGLALGRGVA